MTNSRANQNATQLVIKLVDETVNNSTTFQADDVLLLALKSTTHYKGEFILYINSGSTPDFKFQITVPSGATGDRLDAVQTGTTPELTDPIAEAQTTGLSTDGSIQILHIHFHIITTNAGNIGINWAQNTQDASDSKVLAGSSLMVITST